MYLTDTAIEHPRYAAVRHAGPPGDTHAEWERTLLLAAEDSLEAELDRVPWARLISLHCEQRPGGGCVLSYRWRA
jgi:hypothetical protein